MLTALVLLLAAGDPEVFAAKAKIRALEKQYSIDIQWESFLDEGSGTTISTRVPAPQDLVEFAPILEKLMAIYPAKVWKSGKVAKIVLAKQCLRNGVSWGGFAIHDRKALILDITKAQSDDWTRETFHHELYHLLDPIKDDDWEKLNVENFAYQPITKPLSGSKQRETRRGFVSAYSRTGAVEDRAELFASMVAQPVDLATRAKKEGVLRAKIEKIRSSTTIYGLDSAWWKKRP